MRKNLHGRILKEKPKEQYINTVFKSCSFLFWIWILASSFFSFFFFLGRCHFFFSFFLGPALSDVALLLFSFALFFFFRCDFYFLINLGDCIFFCFFYYSFFSIGHHFFNKGIWVNLHKLTFSIPLFFYSQPNKNEGN